MNVLKRLQVRTVLVKNELRTGLAVETRLQESQDCRRRCSWLQRQGGQNWVRTRISSYWSRWVSGEWVIRWIS